MKVNGLDLPTSSLVQGKGICICLCQSSLCTVFAGSVYFIFLYDLLDQLSCFCLKTIVLMLIKITYWWMKFLSWCSFTTQLWLYPSSIASTDVFGSLLCSLLCICSKTRYRHSFWIYGYLRTLLRVMCLNDESICQDAVPRVVSVYFVKSYEVH